MKRKALSDCADHRKVLISDCGDHQEVKIFGGVTVISRVYRTIYEGILLVASKSTEELKEFVPHISEYVNLPIPAPPLILKYPKKMPANMTQETLKKQVREEAVKKFKASIIKEMKKAVLSAYKPQGLGENSNTNSMVRDQTVCGRKCKKPPPANILDMKELSTVLDNCAMVDCASCGGAILDNCPKVDCASCGGPGCFNVLVTKNMKI